MAGLCHLNSPEPIAEPQEPHEVAEIRWVKPEEIKNLITTDLDLKVAKVLEIAYFIYKLCLMKFNKVSSTRWNFHLV